ncbi:hypothetical protein K440DRAFT_616464 [Wilcoxina mikolae CBS 423.85]|nr:hypothetical protein K440DRAFT_616464 [Wilcoxina mikolae CBS 423.85]
MGSDDTDTRPYCHFKPPSQGYGEFNDIEILLFTTPDEDIFLGVDICHISPGLLKIPTASDRSVIAGLTSEHDIADDPLSLSVGGLWLDVSYHQLGSFACMPACDFMSNWVEDSCYSDVGLLKATMFIVQLVTTEPTIGCRIWIGLSLPAEQEEEEEEERMGVGGYYYQWSTNEPNGSICLC